MILGMHRSGTSCLTGCFEEAGLHLGTVNEKAAFNKKGNKENEDIRRLHDEILSRVNASWDNPPAQDPEWTREETNILKEILKSYEGIALWGIKDPRALFMMRGWQKLSRPVFVGTYRHPQEVATSLVKRAETWNQDMSYEKAYDIWCAYNRKILELYDKEPFPILRYDVPADLYNEKVASVCAILGLNSQANMSFREETLHNHKLDTTELPHKCHEIWEALLSVTF